MNQPSVHRQLQAFNSPLFSNNGTQLQTPLMDADILGISTMSPDILAAYQTIRILTYSTSPHMLKQLFEIAPDSLVECILGSTRTIRNIAHILAAQTEIQRDLQGTLQAFSKTAKDRLVQRIDSGQLRFRLMNGHISHAKVFLLSDGPGGDRCALLGSANFSAQALLGDQYEVILRIRNEYGWNACEEQYLTARQRSSESFPISKELPDGTKPDTVPLLAAPVLASENPVITIPVDTSPPEDDAARNDKYQEIYDIILPHIPKQLLKPGHPEIHLDKRQRERFSGIIRKVTSAQPPHHPTLSLDLASHHATLNGNHWPFDTSDEDVAADAAMLISYWDTYEHYFQGDTNRLQHDYFLFLCWTFFTPLISTLRRRFTLHKLDPIQTPRFGILYGQSNSGKSLLIQTITRFMFGNNAPQALRANKITTAQIHAIDAAFRRMPATLDDLSSKRFNDHIKDVIKDETIPHTDEQPCYIISMNATYDPFVPEISKRILHIYTMASFPANREQARIEIANKLATIEPTTSLYRRYLLNVMDQIPTDPDDLSSFDWLLLSSTVLTKLLHQHAKLPHWARTTTWTEHANSRFDLVSKQLNSLLDPTLQQSSRAKLVPSTWYASRDQVRIRLEVNSFNRPSFDWKNLPGYLIIAGESRTAELVLDRRETEKFIGRNLTPSRWLSALRNLGPITFVGRY